MLWTRQLRPPEICTLCHQPNRIPSSAFVCGAIILVALDKQFDHHRTKPRSSVRWRNESWQTGKSAERRTADILSARRPRDTSISLNTSCANEIIYCGYRFDPESQLYYVRNRTYNALLGRWIQRGPIGYQGRINFYQFVGSGPVGMVDPSGLKEAKIPGVYYYKAYATASPRATFVHAFIEVGGVYYGFFPVVGSGTTWAVFKDTFWLTPGVVHTNDSYSLLPIGYANALTLHGDYFLRKYAVYVDDCEVDVKKAAAEIAKLAAAAKARPPYYNAGLSNCAEWAINVIYFGVAMEMGPGPHPHFYLYYQRVQSGRAGAKLAGGLAGR